MSEFLEGFHRGHTPTLQSVMLINVDKVIEKTFRQEITAPTQVE